MSASAAKRRCVELLDTCLRQKALDAAARNAGAEGSGSLPAQGASSGMSFTVPLSLLLSVCVPLSALAEAQSCLSHRSRVSSSPPLAPPPRSR